MITKEAIIERFGTVGPFREFCDFTSLRVAGEIDYTHIDVAMHDIIKRLNELGLYTISCCDGGRRPETSYITFDTTVTLEQVMERMRTDKIRYRMSVAQNYNVDFDDVSVFSSVRVNCPLDKWSELFGLDE